MESEIVASSDSDTVYRCNQCLLDIAIVPDEKNLLKKKFKKNLHNFEFTAK